MCQRPYRNCLARPITQHVSQSEVWRVQTSAETTTATQRSPLRNSLLLESSDFDHLEIQLADAAVWAQPVFRNVLPQGAWSDALIRPTEAFVVDQATDHTLPLFHFATTSTLQAFWRSGRWL